MGSLIPSRVDRLVRKGECCKQIVCGECWRHFELCCLNFDKFSGGDPIPGINAHRVCLELGLLPRHDFLCDCMCLPKILGPTSPQRFCKVWLVRLPNAGTPLPALPDRIKKRKVG